MPIEYYNRIVSGIFLFQILGVLYLFLSRFRLFGADFVWATLLNPGWGDWFWIILYSGLMIFIVVSSRAQYKRFGMKANWLGVVSLVVYYTLMLSDSLLRFAVSDYNFARPETEHLPDLPWVAFSYAIFINWVFYAVRTDVRYVVRRRFFSLATLSFGWAKLLFGVGGVGYLLLQWRQLRLLDFDRVWSVFRVNLFDPAVLSVVLFALLALFYVRPPASNKEVIRRNDTLLLIGFYLGMFWESSMFDVWREYERLLGIWDLPPSIELLRYLSFVCVGLIILAGCFLRGPKVEAYRVRTKELA